ncbi:hypothetical protein L6452_06106 [Arctium lappa]|uniref:Uncharacterized protein n=1 Tax=Arctium lappa TaxID=4217 RepID=A0ACB9EHX8_ARCLA|nr:hypothetical protein L6452_06106 [Arctium lappa]
MSNRLAINLDPVEEQTPVQFYNYNKTGVLEPKYLHTLTNNILPKSTNNTMHLTYKQSILIQLKNKLQFNSSVSTKLVSWNPNVTTDCCKWKGVNCSSRGQVVGLDLSKETISGGIDL